MAKVELAPEFSRISGRLCGTEKTVVAVNKKTGKMHRYDYHAPKSTKPSSDQLAVRNTFKRKVQAAKKWYDANKPASASVTPTEDWKAVKKAYDAQNKIGNIFSYVRSLIQDNYKIRIGGVDKEIQGFYYADEDGLGS